MSSPLVIVGIGGSGTRALARLVEATGRHLGSRQNDSNDALALFRLANRWCGPVHRAWTEGRPFDQQSEFEADLAASVARHREGAPAAGPWGWKQPRSAHLLPALSRAYGDRLSVLHVVRDGRDVALGKTVHLELARDYALPADARGKPAPEQLASMWGAVNELVADFGQERLGDRYLRVRLEDLCDDVADVGGEILELAGGSVTAERLAGIVRSPSSIGRWRMAEPAKVKRIERTCDGALRRFGYVA